MTANRQQLLCAATERHCRGEVRKHASYFNKRGIQQLGINAGLVVLRPDYTEFQGTLELLEDDHFANHSQVASRNRGVYTETLLVKVRKHGSRVAQQHPNVR